MAPSSICDEADHPHCRFPRTAADSGPLLWGERDFVHYKLMISQCDRRSQMMVVLCSQFRVLNREPAQSPAPPLIDPRDLALPLTSCRGECPASSRLQHVEPASKSALRRPQSAASCPM